MRLHRHGLAVQGAATQLQTPPARVPEAKTVLPADEVPSATQVASDGHESAVTEANPVGTVAEAHWSEGLASDAKLGAAPIDGARPPAKHAPVVGVQAISRTVPVEAGGEDWFGFKAVRAMEGMA